MKGRICSVCLNSDILCAACRKKVGNGEVSETEIRVLKALGDVSKSFRPLAEVEIKKVIEGGKTIVLVTRKGDAPRVVGKKGVMAKKLSRIVGRPLRVVDESDNMKEFIEGLISPVPVIGINVVYSDGEESLKVMIPKGRNAPVSKGSFSEIIKTVFGKNAVVSNS